jgi:hypothetical protein
MHMCQSCQLPENERPRIRRAAMIVWGAILLATAATGLVATLGGGPDAPPAQRSARLVDRVFYDDMARQAADAGRLVAQASGSSRVLALARRIEVADRGVLVHGAAEELPRPTWLAAPVDSDVRAGIRRHIAQDRIIARIALETATTSAARRAAALLLRRSRDWTVPTQS